MKPLAISTKISSLFATENYCKWNRNILSSTPFRSGMTACSMHIKKTRVTSQNQWLPLSNLSKFVTNLVTPSLPLGCDVIYGRPLSKACVWGAIHKNIISDRFSTKTAISAHI